MCPPHHWSASDRSVLVCRGTLELQCKGEQAGEQYDVNIQCRGVSYPAFKTCKGLTTSHVSTGGDQVRRPILACACASEAPSVGPDPGHPTGPCA